MVRAAAAAAVAALCCAAGAYAQGGSVAASQMSPVKAPKLKLLWSEEFKGKHGLPSTVLTSSRVDSKKYFWTTEINGNPNNRERQFYLDTPVQYNTTGSVKHWAIELDGSGNLAINAQAPRPAGVTYPSTYPYVDCGYGQCEWLSGRMNTQGKLGFMYGRIEARIKVPEGEGTWPAFWMLGANINKVNWPSCGEIDIMEASATNRYGQAFGSLHSQPDDQYNYGITASVSPDNFYSAFHTYAIDWVKDRIDFSVDGKVYNSVTKAIMTSTSNAVQTQYGKLARRGWPFNQEFFLIVNLAMGGSIGGDPNDEFRAPAGATGGTMLIDYIRYYAINGIGKLVRH